MRVWKNNWGGFLASQKGHGHGPGIELRMKTSAEFDKAVMGEFNAELNGASSKKAGAGFTEYTLADSYTLWGNNCTTQSLGAMFGAEASTGTQIPGFQMFQGDRSPGGVFNQIQSAAVTQEKGQTYDPGTVLKVCPDGTHCHFEMR
jgi:hypothetical protein